MGRVLANKATKWCRWTLGLVRIEIIRTEEAGGHAWGNERANVG